MDNNKYSNWTTYEIGTKYNIKSPNGKLYGSKRIFECLAKNKNIKIKSNDFGSTEHLRSRLEDAGYFVVPAENSQQNKFKMWLRNTKNISGKTLVAYTEEILEKTKEIINQSNKVADLMEQKIIKAFSLTRENKNVRAALWAQMQIHTPEDCKTVNYTNRQAPFIFEKNNNSEWSLTNDGIKFIEENFADQLELLNSKSSQRKIEDFYKFITFHQSYSYEEFVEGIKPNLLLLKNILRKS